MRRGVTDWLSEWGETKSRPITPQQEKLTTVEKLSVGHWLIRSDLKSINYNDDAEMTIVKWRCRISWCIFCSHSISFRYTFRVPPHYSAPVLSGQVMEDLYELYSKRYSLIFIESAAASAVCLLLVMPLWIRRSSKSVNQTNTDRSRCLFALGDNYTSQHPVWCTRWTRLVKYSRIVQLSSPAATDWDVFFSGLVAA